MTPAHIFGLSRAASASWKTLVIGVLVFSMRDGTTPALGQQATVTGSWSPEALAAMVDARDDSIRTVDITVVDTRMADADSDGYLAEVQAYDREVARFFGVPHTAKRVVTSKESHVPVPRHLRFWRNDKGHSRIEEYTRAPTSDTQADLDVIARECFQGQRWERYLPHFPGNPRLHFGDVRVMPRVSAAAGLAMPELTATACPTAFGEFLQEAISSKRLRAVSEVTSETGELRVRTEVLWPRPEKSAVPFFDLVTIDFDPLRSWVPTRFTCEWAFGEPAEVKVFEVPRGYKAAWSEFFEAAEEIWVARKFVITEYASVAMPVDNAGFRAATENGKPKMLNGERQIDLSRARVRTFTMGHSTYEVASISINQSVPDPLCPSVYAPGTVVQDDTTQDIRYISGTNPAVDALLVEEIGNRRHHTVRAKSRMWIVAANVVFILGLGGYAMYRLRARPS